MQLSGLKLTYLGHSTFTVTTKSNKTIMIDPWLANNPSCPAQYHEASADLLVATHGHVDHIGDLAAAQARNNARVAAMYEITHWLETSQEHVDNKQMIPMNKGGTVPIDDLGLSLTMTDARHSSSFIQQDGSLAYLGEAAGFILAFGDITIYVAGDTCLFGDMRLIAEVHRPNIAILPIGDRFTMGPQEAAYATEMLRPETVIPCHFGTFPLLTGTPQAFKEALQRRHLAESTEVMVLQPGEAIG